MNALDRLRVRLTPRSAIQCVTNTFLPDRDGERYRVYSVELTDATIGGIGCQRTGKIRVPADVRDVEWLDIDTVRWPLYGRVGHYVTFRFLDAAGNPLPTTGPVVTTRCPE